MITLPSQIQKHIEQEAEKNHPRNETFPDDHIRETFIEGAQSLWSKLTEMNEDQEKAIADAAIEYSNEYPTDASLELKWGFEQGAPFGIALSRSESEKKIEDIIQKYNVALKEKSKKLHDANMNLAKACGTMAGLGLSMGNEQIEILQSKLDRANALIDELNKALLTCICNDNSDALEHLAKYREENGVKE